MLAHDIDDSNPQALFNQVTKSLAGKWIAYLHIIEGDTSGKPVPVFDYVALKRLFGGSHRQQQPGVLARQAKNWESSPRSRTRNSRPR